MFRLRLWICEPRHGPALTPRSSRNCSQEKVNNGPAESRAWRQLNGGMVQRGSGGPESNRGNLWQAQGTSRRVTATGKAKCAVVQAKEVRTAVDLPTRRISQNGGQARAPLLAEPARIRTVKSACCSGICDASANTRTLQPHNVGR